MENVVERVLDWDDVIENDGVEWVTLPEGDYKFKVAGFERARHAGSTKIPPCNKAILTIEVEAPQGTATVKHNLYLYSKQEWKLCQFFTSIGQRKHGEPFRMDWNAVAGATGRCRLGIHKWIGEKDGKEYSNNEILKFYDPEEPANATAETPKYTPGEF